MSTKVDPFDNGAGDTLQSLVGAKMIAARWDGENLYFVTDRGTFKGRPEGDCCAHCYVQHVSGTDALAEGAIVNATELIGGTSTQAEYGDVSDTWGHRIRTSKGICSIEMRVDHNGYYGGALEFGRCDSAPVAAKPLDDF